MAESYGKFIQAIDNFENYSRDVIEQCAEFSQLAASIGSKIGSGVEYLAKETSKELNKRDDVGFLAKAGVAAVGTFAKDALSFAGLAIGEWRTNAKYKKTQKKILADGMAYKETAFEMIPKSLEVCKIYLEACESNIKVLKEKLLDNVQRSDDELKNITEELHACIQKYYQVEYRFELANNIIKYFDEFEEQLTDLENYVIWHENNILINKIECYKCSYNKVYELCTLNTNEDEKEKIDTIFQIEGCYSPVLITEDVPTADWVYWEVKKKIISEKKNKSFNKLFPDFFYETEAFNEVYEIVSSHFYNYVIPKYRKIAAILLTIPSITVTAIYSILYFTGVFGFQKLLSFSIPKYSDIIGLFAFIELIFIIIVCIRDKKMYKSYWLKCGKINGREFFTKMDELAIKYAYDEKEISSEDFEQLVTPQNALISETGEKISEEDLLSSIMNNE